MKNLVSIALGMLIFFLFIQTFATIADVAFKRKTTFPVSTIIGRGTAKVAAKPDVANFSITIRELDSDVEKSQQKMVAKANKAIDSMKENGIKKEDIKTENYSTYPKYSYAPVICRNGVCPPSKQVLEGYEAVETLSVKIRNLEKAGEIVTKIAQLKIGEVSGMFFAIDDVEKFKNEARVEAIKKAKEDAKLTAKNLGVSLGKIVMYNEEAPGFFPVERRMMMAKPLDGVGVAELPKIEPGEQMVSASVIVTYEMRQ
jgi:hypothetical protein